MNRRHATVVVLALVALSALLAWWLLAEDADVVRPAPRAEPVAPPSHETPPPPAPPKRSRAAPEASPATDEAKTAAAVAAEEPDGAPLFPTVSVEVRHADGSPVQRAMVYALRSGDDLPAASSRVDDAGACVLRLPGPGVYDFGADTEDDLLSALVTEVDAVTTPRVRLELPATAEIELDADETIPRGTAARLRIVGDDGSSRDRGFSASHLPVTFTARAGARFRLRSGSAEVRFVPDRVTAPGSATLRRDDRGRIRLLVTVVPANRVARHHAVLHTEFEVEGGGAVDPWDDVSRDWIAAEGVRLADTFRSRPEWVKSALAPRGTLRWSGAGIAPGSVGFEAPDSETVDVPVTLRLDDTLPGEAECAVTIEGPADARDLKLWVLSPDGLGSEGQPATIGAQTVVAPAGWPSALVYATADGLVSAAKPFDAQRPLVLTLGPAGRVRVIRGILPPRDIDLVLRRKDGGAMPFGDLPGEEQHVVSAHLNVPSVVVGPLPAGDVTFVVSCAGRDLAEVTAHVVAGRTTDVLLPFADRLAAGKR